jgi:hypothetical protein
VSALTSGGLEACVRTDQAVSGGLEAVSVLTSGGLEAVSVLTSGGLEAVSALTSGGLEACVRIDQAVSGGLENFSRSEHSLPFMEPEGSLPCSQKPTLHHMQGCLNPINLRSIVIQ